jgi:hypothetical protein
MVAGERANDCEPISIKLTGGKSGGCVSKAVELTSGDLRHVTESELRMKRFILTVSQKSAGKASGTPMPKGGATDKPSRER